MNPDVSNEVPRDLELSLVGAPRVYRIVPPQEVYRRLTLSVPHTYRLQQQGRFPQWVRDDNGRVLGLFEHVLDAFCHQRICAREGMPPLGYRSPLPVFEFRVEDVPAEIGVCFLRLAAVEALIGRKREWIYANGRAGRFPGQVPLGEVATAWAAHEVHAWLRGRCPTGEALPGAADPRLTLTAGPVPSALAARRSGCRS